MEHTGAGGVVLTSDSADAAPADRTFYGSCMILEAESLDAARKLIENDIFYKEGVVRILCLTHFRASLTAA